MVERRDTFIRFNHTQAISCGLNERVSVVAPRLCVNLSGEVAPDTRGVDSSRTASSPSPFPA